METIQTKAGKWRKLIWLYCAGLALPAVLLFNPFTNRIKFLVERYTEPSVMVDSAKLSELDVAFLSVKAHDFQRGLDWNSPISSETWQQLRDKYSLMPQFALASVNFNCRLWDVNCALWDGSSLDYDRPFAVEIMNCARASSDMDFPLLLRLYINRELWNWIDNHPRPGFNSQIAINDIDIAKLWKKHCPSGNSPQGKLERQLLRDMHKCAPDQALTFYLEAIQCCREGRNADAQRFLELGNAAPQCDFPAGPPFDEAWAQASQGHAFGGDPALSALIDLRALSRDQFNLALDQASMLLSVAAVDENNPELLNDLNVALCRIAAAAPVGFWQGFAISQGFEHLVDATNIRRATTSIPAAPDGFDQYREKVEALDLHLGGLECGTGSINSQDTILEKLDSLADRFTHGRSSQAIRLATIRDDGREMIADCKAVAQNNLPILRDLQRFDFVSLRWRDD